MRTAAEDFLEAMVGAELPLDERMICCGFPGDPDEAGPEAWRPKPWRPGRELPLGSACNGYVTVSSFRQAADGTWRRRGECFAGGRALMVDDVGTKVDRATMEGRTPSAIVETSPGNEQWWYFLDEPQRDRDRWDALIRAFIAQKLLGADPGMSGVTRVGRLPGFLNGKRKYGGAFRVRLVLLTQRRFSERELIDAFGLKLMGTRRPLADRRLLPEDLVARATAWGATHTWLQQNRMLKKSESDTSGWWEMTCPWVADHTAGADTGAAMREPAEDNGYYGAFRCHHGHCADKGWADLTDWVAEEAAEELERSNAQ